MIGQTLKFSVVTVCWNSESTIEACLRSVMAQDGVEVEHIIIDGGSMDRTIDIIQSIEGWDGTLVSEPDQGIYDGMNKGLSRATGDYIGFLNSDDVYAAPNVLAKLSAGAADGPDALVGDVQLYNPETGRNVRFFSGKGQWRPRLKFGSLPPHPGFYARPECLRDLGGFSLSYKIAADTNLLVKFFNTPSYRYVHVPATIVKMAIGGASTSGLKSTLIINKELKRICRENHIRTNIFLLNFRLLAKARQFFFKPQKTP